MDRSQMLQQELGRVDMALEEFMSLVAPKLQLRDAQVAMEWLVRRFRYSTPFLTM